MTILSIVSILLITILVVAGCITHEYKATRKRHKIAILLAMEKAGNHCGRADMLSNQDTKFRLPKAQDLDDYLKTLEDNRFIKTTHRHPPKYYITRRGRKELERLLPNGP